MKMEDNIQHFNKGIGYEEEEEKKKELYLLV